MLSGYGCCLSCRRLGTYGHGSGLSSGYRWVSMGIDGYRWVWRVMDVVDMDDVCLVERVWMLLGMDVVG